MIQEAYCSFEVAKLLKEKGFNEPVTELNKLVFQDGERPILKITHQKAMAWLRDKGIHVSPKYCCFCGSKKSDKPYFLWEPTVFRLPSNNIIFPQPLDMCKHYESYEDAVEAALKYSIENLI